MHGSPTGGPVAVLLAVGNSALCAAVRAALEERQDVEVIGHHAGEVPPLGGTAVVVAGGSGGAVRAVGGWDAELLDRTVLLVDDDGAVLLAGAALAGVRTFVTSDSSAEELVAAIMTVHAGWAVVARRLVRPLLDGLAATCGPAGVGRAPATLTMREREVLRAVCEGMSNREIAHRLDVSVRTVKFHVSNVLTKLKVRSRTQLIARATRPE